MPVSDASPSSAVPADDVLVDNDATAIKHERPRLATILHRVSMRSPARSTFLIRAGLPAELSHARSSILADLDVSGVMAGLPPMPHAP